MMRVASLTNLSDRQLDRLIRRVALLAFVVLIGFVAFYVVDRYRLPQAGPLDRRLAALEAAVTSNPSDIASRGSLADAYVAAKRYEDALAQYDAVLATGKAAEPAHLGRAKVYQAMGQLDASATDFQWVIDFAKKGEMANVDPNLATAYYGLGTIRLSQSRAADAVTALESAFAIDRTDADTLGALGKAYLAKGDTKDAIGALRGAVTFVPLGWAEPYATLATAYTKTSETAEATWASAMADLAAGNGGTVEVRLKSITSGAAALDAAIGLGLMYESRGDGVAATEWYGKAKAIDPQSSAANLGLARVTPDASATAGTSPAASLPAPGQLQGGKP